MSNDDAAVVQPRRGYTLALLALLCANVFLALGPWFVRVTDVGPVSAAFWRMALALPVLVALTVAAGAARRVSRGAALALVVGGLCLAGDLGLWYVGIHHTRLANATLFANASSFLFPLYGFLVARALPSRIHAIALVLAALGAALLVGRSAELSMANVGGDLLSLAAGATYVIYLIALERTRTVHPLAALTIATAAATLPLLFAALLLREQLLPRDWTPLLLLAASSQILGHGLVIYAMGRLPTLLFGLLLLLQPIITAAIGWTVYGEHLGVVDVAGAATIAAALVLVRRPARRQPAPAAASQDVIGPA